ncbi:MAG: UPF0280 family protein [Thermodesulfobacteriota bacterium]
MIYSAEIHEPVQVLSEDLVLVDWGPMTLTIAAWRRGRARPVMAAKAARSALDSLQVLADFQGYMKLLTGSLPEDRPLPRVVERARKAARAVDGGLTSLAAVAGAVADEVALSAANLGADKVIVNNGGDLALILKGRTTATVGLKAPRSSEMVGRLTLKAGDRIRGVASSGWEGRSFSRGIADLVTVWAENASLADAAATFIAGQVVVRDSKIRQVRAREVDPLSDLGHALVTVAVGPLSPSQCRQALKQGLIATQNLFKAHLIRGCLIKVQGNMLIFDPDRIFSGSSREGGCSLLNEV